MTDNQIHLDVRTERGGLCGHEPSGASPSAIALTCDRIRVASRAYAMVGVPDFGIVTILRDATDERHFTWIEQFPRDADGPAGPAFVVGDVAALASAVTRARALAEYGSPRYAVALGGR